MHSSKDGTMARKRKDRGENKNRNASTTKKGPGRFHLNGHQKVSSKASFNMMQFQAMANAQAAGYRAEGV